MINLTREEAQQVLDAFEAYQYNGSVQLFDAAIETLRARLALHDMNKAAEQNGEEL
jgi:hypothetical protein